MAIPRPLSQLINVHKTFMQLEIEVKLKVKNKASLVKKILALGAKKVGQKHIIDTYYSPAKGPCFVTHSSPKLRIRYDKLHNHTSLDFHLPKGQWGGQEMEVDVSDVKMMKLIFQKLNFKIEAIVDNHRTKYQWRQFNFDLDQVKGAGTFLEIEWMNPKSAKKAVVEIKKLMKQIGFTEKDLEKKRYWQMCLLK